MTRWPWEMGLYFQNDHLRTYIMDQVVKKLSDEYHKIPQNIFDGKSALIQVMAWCHQAPSHCLR